MKRWLIGFFLTIPLLASGGSPSEMTNFDYYSETGETHLVFGVNNPFFYTLYRATPDTLVLELPGVDAAKQSAKREIKTNEVSAVAFDVQSSGTPQAKTRVTISLNPNVAHSHWMQGTNLYIDLQGETPMRTESAVSQETEKPALASEKEDTPVPTEIALLTEPPVLEDEEIEETQEAEEPKTAAPSKLETAQLLRGVNIKDGKILIYGDGQFKYETFVLDNPHRVVIDLLGVMNEVGNKTIRGDGYVERVRVAQFSVQPKKITRIVLDLQKPSEYEVSQSGSALEVRLGAERQTTASAATKKETESDNPAASLTPPPATPAKAVKKEEPAKAETSNPKIAVNRDLAPSNIKPKAEIKATPEPITKEDLSILGLDAMEVTRLESSQVALGTKYRADETSIEAAIEKKVVYKGKPITFNLKDMDIKDVFRFFHEISGLNFVLDPAVSGKVTLVLRDVPWDQALDIILRNAKLGKVLEGNVIFIAPLARLAAEEKQRKQIQEEREAAMDPVTKPIRLSYAKTSEMASLIKASKMLSKNGQVFDDKRTNTLFIKDVPERVEIVEQLVRAVDVSTPQVEIESRIVETTKDFTKGLGIIWGASASADQAHGTTTNFQFPHRIRGDYNVILPAPGAFSFLNLSMGNVLDTFTLDVQLSAMERAGRGKILSAPRVVTMNNQKATIETGVQIPIFSTTDLQINVTFQNATLKLDVTPQITAEGTVIMDVSIDKSEPGTLISGGSTSAREIITRKAKTQVLVKDGGTAVIGGVFQASETYSEQRVPGFHKIPGLSWLFKSKTKTSRNDELLIFITPRIQKLQT